MIWDLEKSGNVAESNAHADALAHSLRTGSVVSSTPIGVGITGAHLVGLDNGARAVLKKSFPKSGITSNAEVAAYKLDRFFGGNLSVPVTIRREIDGVSYSLQAWIKNSEQFSSRTRLSHRASLYFFDYLIDNTDRRFPNLLVHRSENQGRVVAIDHGLSFRSEWVERQGVKPDRSWSLKMRNYCEGFFSSRISESCVREFILLQAPPKRLYEQLKSTSEAVFRNLLQDDLSPQEIDAFLKRVREMITTIEDAQLRGFQFPL